MVVTVVAWVIMLLLGSGVHVVCMLCSLFSYWQFIVPASLCVCVSFFVYVCGSDFEKLQHGPTPDPTRDSRDKRVPRMTQYCNYVFASAPAEFLG